MNTRLLVGSLLFCFFLFELSNKVGLNVGWHWLVFLVLHCVLSLALEEEEEGGGEEEEICCMHGGQGGPAGQHSHHMEYALGDFVCVGACMCVCLYTDLSRREEL